MRRFRSGPVRGLVGLVAVLLTVGRGAASPWLHECSAGTASVAGAPAMAAGHEHHAGADRSSETHPACDDCRAHCALSLAASLPAAEPVIRPLDSVLIAAPTDRPALAIGRLDLRLPFATAPPARG